MSSLAILSRARGSVQKLFFSATACASDSAPKRGMPKKRVAKFYAVQVGRIPGVYRTWDECLEQVNKFGGAKYKSFRSQEEAAAFVVGQAETGLESAIKSTIAKNGSTSTVGPKKRRKEATAEPEGAPAVNLVDPVKRARTQQDAMNPLYNLFFDGGARGNPGPGGSGACISGPRRKRIWEGSFYQGYCTNNQAEYQGLIEGLKAAAAAGVRRLNVRGDSNLIIQQLQGNWKVKNKELKVKYKEALDIAQHFEEVNYGHVYREHNKKADELANRAMDKESNYEKWFVDSPTK